MGGLVGVARRGGFGDWGGVWGVYVCVVEWGEGKRGERRSVDERAGRQGVCMHGREATNQTQKEASNQG